MGDNGAGIPLSLRGVCKMWETGRGELFVLRRGCDCGWGGGVGRDFGGIIDGVL
jgi:hypothetical protein